MEGEKVDEKNVSDILFYFGKLGNKHTLGSGTE